MNTHIPQKLIDALFHEVEDCVVTTYDEISFDVSSGISKSGLDDDTVVLILPGWVAHDGNAEVEYTGAESGEEAANLYVDGGDWGESDKTEWISVYAWRRAVALDMDGDLVELTLLRDEHTIEIPTAPHNGATS
jgi:hypothetical protein